MSRRGGSGSEEVSGVEAVASASDDRVSEILPSGDTVTSLVVFEIVGSSFLSVSWRKGCPRGVSSACRSAAISYSVLAFGLLESDDGGRSMGISAAEESSPEGDSLAANARRWRRFIVVALP